VVPVVKTVVKNDALDALVEPAVLVEDVETLDDSVVLVANVGVLPVKAVPAVVVDVRTVVPRIFCKVRCTNV
jgi:hypothetical protein